MGRDIDREPPTPYHEYDRAEFRAFIGFWRLANDKFPDHYLSGYSVKRTAGGFLVVVRAFDHLNKRSVVVFGSGPVRFDAVRNASLAAGKMQWKPDKFGWP